MRNVVLYLLLMVSTLAATAQLKVTGTVISADDQEPLIGAYVRDLGKRTNNVAVTDIDGKYEITVNPGSTIEFTYVGCTPVRKVINESQTLDILMESTNQLDEVVVVGYGTMKKSDLTGSVSTVAADNLKKTPAASLANALQGQAAGVTVNSLTGRPGHSAEVRIRGVGSVNGSSPIYVVDGVITDNIDFLAPGDIERTEILKDASATAIYGARGANGVVLVTTKSGSTNKRATISLDAYVGVQSRWRKLDVMNAQDFADTYVAINGNARAKKMYEEQGFNAWLKTFQGVGASPYYPTVYDPETNPTGFDYSAVDTDWQDEVFRDAMIQNYHLSIDGGTDKLTYSLSGSWFGQQGTIIGSDYSRFTARLNTTYKVTNWLKVGENLSFSASTAKNAYESGDNSESAGANILSAAFAMAPWDPTRYPEGSVNRNGKDLSGGISAGSNFKNVTNPLSMVEYSHPKSRRERWVGNVFAEIQPISDLTFRSSYSFDYCLATDKSFAEAYEVSAYDKRTKNFLSSSMARSFSWNVDNILTYTHTFADKHYLQAMVGQTVEQYDYYSIGNSGANIINPVEKNWYLSQVTEDFGRPADSVARNRRFSWLGRIHYAYDNRYLLTVNFRADGSSRFPENAWGYFPSFALAWRISEEKFMQDFTNLSNLKLRFGWGQVGNDLISDNAFMLNVFNSGPTFVDYVFGKDQALAPGATVLTWVNRGGHWENTEQWSVGIDFGFWQNKFTGTVEGFIRDTNDMLMGVTAPAHVGNRYSATANVGKVRNQGIEITLEHRNHVGNVNYNISGNVSFIKNELLKLNGGSPIYTNYNNVQVVDEGHSLYYFWGYQYDGVYRTDQEALDYLKGYTAADCPFHAGDAKYIDNSGDGRISDEDRVDLGSSIPWLNYGLNLGAEWKGFDIQLFFQGVAGNKIYNQMRHRLESNGTTSVLSPVMKDAWTEANPDGSIPNPKNSINYYVSDRFLENGAYFRLKNLQIGYSLPEKLISRAGFTKCRFYVQAGNVFTLIGYKGFDPEVSGGVDYGNYPQSRSFIFGVNITY